MFLRRNLTKQKLEYMYIKCRKTQIRLNAATLKESPAKGYQHFAKSAMKGQKSP